MTYFVKLLFKVIWSLQTQTQCINCRQLALAFQALKRFDGCGQSVSLQRALTLTDKSCWEDGTSVSFIRVDSSLVCFPVTLKSLCLYRTGLYCTGHVVRRGGRVLGLVFVLCPDFCGKHKCIFAGCRVCF